MVAEPNGDGSHQDTKNATCDEQSIVSDGVRPKGFQSLSKSPGGIEREAAVGKGLRVHPVSLKLSGDLDHVAFVRVCAEGMEKTGKSQAQRKGNYRNQDYEVPSFGNEPAHGWLLNGRGGD